MFFLQKWHIRRLDIETTVRYKLTLFIVSCNNV
jgi:hypothetical protein